MVTTRKTSDSKVIAMDEKTGGAAAPPRTLLEEVNSQLMCVLCRGYYIDATTIVECLHSFCRSCIVKHLQVKSYCPICEMMINSAKPNIKPDKALQDIVYKLVPGLFQREMQRRQAFYASRPGPAASATPEQRGEDTERIIFSPEDVISFSLEYMDLADRESASSRSSESGSEGAPNEAGAPTRRYLQCPAVVNISHLKKFLSVKYDVDASNFFVDILYKRVPLPDYYTLMDIAYIYNWKRNEPMRFFYQISDFSALRDRFGFFGLKRPGALGPSPPSPAPSQLTEAGSDASSGTFSPVPDDKSQSEFPSKDGRSETDRDLKVDVSDPTSSQSSSVDVEKSQFLNSFELTAKCGAGSGNCSSSPSKETNPSCDIKPEILSPKKIHEKSSINVKMETDKSPTKRKSSSDQVSEGKKIKLTPEKKSCDPPVKPPPTPPLRSPPPRGAASSGGPTVSKPSPTTDNKANTGPPLRSNSVESASKTDGKFTKPVINSSSITSTMYMLNSTLNPFPLAAKPSPVKRKLSEELVPPLLPPAASKGPAVAKSEPMKSDVSPSSKKSEVKQRILTAENNTSVQTNSKANVPQRLPPKPDISKQLPIEMKKDIPKNTNLPPPNRPPLKMPNTNAPKTQGDPLKSLFHSCNINIPSSLSITLTDEKKQKTNDNSNDQESKNQSQGNLPPVSSSQTQTNFPQKSANTEVHNYIEILKLPDLDVASKTVEDKNSKSSGSNKGSDAATGGKGPVPNLKPISDTKQSKTVPITKPQTFQQTFLQSLQQQSEKPKYLKTRLDFPKITTPASTKTSEEVSNPTPEQAPTSTSTPTTPVTSTPATTTATAPTATPTPTPAPVLVLTPPVSKPPSVPPAKYTSKPVPMAQPIRKPNPAPPPKVTKPDSALDLSTPHSTPSQLGAQQAKALKTMQSITNIAKRQSHTQRMTSPSQVFLQDSFKMNIGNASPIRIPVPPPHSKLLKNSASTQISAASSPKHFSDYMQSTKSLNSRMSNNGSPILSSKSSSSQQTSATYSLGSQRSQTRSPSSSPKLVIACPSPKSQSPEDKQSVSPRSTDASSQSNLISSSHISSSNRANNELPSSKESVGTKPPKAVKMAPPNKGSTPRGNPSISQTQSALLLQQQYLRQQLDLQTQLGLLPPGAAAQWFNNPVARSQFENIMKNMNHNPHMPFSNNHNAKDN